MSYDEPRLAALYDVDNPDGPDHDFFRRRAAELDATRIVDLGCGTGLLTVTLAWPGRTVTGIDPAAAMLDLARQRPGGEAVRWVLGTADAIEPRSADLVVMSGNVAMHLIGEAWHRALARIAAGLVPGGRLVFESRNPDARAWERWSQEPTERDTPSGRLRESARVDPPDADGVVVMHCHNDFLDDGEVVDVDVALQFRSRSRIEGDLGDVGLVVSQVHATWSEEPFRGGANQPLMVFEALRPVEGSTPSSASARG